MMSVAYTVKTIVFEAEEDNGLDPPWVGLPVGERVVAVLDSSKVREVPAKWYVTVLVEAL